jgi:transposase
MAQVDYIRHLYESEGKSLREISRITGHQFRTVKKYAYENDFRGAELPSMEASKYPVLGPYLQTIDEWLEADERAPRKQRHTITRIFTRLQEEKGFAGCYSSVKRYVGRKRWFLSQEKSEGGGYLPIEQPVGHAQIDFGEFQYNDGSGVSRTGHALTVTFPYSNAGWTQVFASENQECLLEGMQRIFGHIGGVPLRLRMDNMTAAVTKVLKGYERIFSEGFTRFRLHYRFEVDVCNPDAGNEKGNVENKVGYTRRNLFVPLPVITDMEEFNQSLLQKCDADHDREHYRHGLPISELFEEERVKLLHLPEYPYEAFRYESFRVSKTGFIVFEKNSYGLSPMLSGKSVQAKVFYNRIEFYFEHQLLKTYPRCYDRQAELMDWRMYLPTLLKKPGSVEHTRFFGQMPKLWQSYLRSIHGRERKSALQLLHEIVSAGNEGICETVLELTSEALHGEPDVDSIRQCYLTLSDTRGSPAPLSLTSKPLQWVYRPDLTAYNALLSPHTYTSVDQDAGGEA